MSCLGGYDSCKKFSDDQHIQSNILIQFYVTLQKLTTSLNSFDSFIYISFFRKKGVLVMPCHLRPPGKPIHALLTSDRDCSYLSQFLNLMY